MKKINFTQLKSILPAYIKADKPVMLWGSPGAGKSGFVRSVVDNLGYDLQDFRLLMRDAVDVHGLPTMNNGRMAWAYPKEMPLASDNIEKKRVMFLDELPAAPTSVQTVAYQMLHERAIDDTPLHKNVRFIAAGNRERDGAVSNRMPTPLCNRMAHFDVQPDTKSWLEWGHSAGIHPFILAFIENAPQHLFVQDEKEYTTQKTFASPRSWEYSSDVMFEAIPNYEDISEGDYSLIEDIATSFVGAANAAAFIGYAQVGAKLPKSSDILNGKVAPKRFELHEQFFISCSALAQLSESIKKGDNDVSSKLDNLLSFAKESFDAETLSTFGTRAFNPNWYGIKLNPKSHVQSDFARWLYGGKDGYAALVWQK